MHNGMETQAPKSDDVMSFVAYCFKCETKVTAHTLLDGNELLSALDNDFVVRPAFRHVSQHTICMYLQ